MTDASQRAREIVSWFMLKPTKCDIVGEYQTLVSSVTAQLVAYGEEREKLAVQALEKMKTEKQIRKRLRRCLKKRPDWFCDSSGTERNYETIRVLTWVLKRTKYDRDRCLGLAKRIRKLNHG